VFPVKYELKFLNNEEDICTSKRSVYYNARENSAGECRNE
jgi:hypothetical protein